MANNATRYTWNLTSAQGGKNVAQSPAGGFSFDLVENIIGGDKADNFSLKFTGESTSSRLLDGGAGLIPSRRVAALARSTRCLMLPIIPTPWLP